MSAIPSKTGIPEIVNVNLTNTVDFHVAATNFNNVLDRYINFLALTKYYESLKYKADPITAEVDFWEKLTSSSINLKEFAKNPKAMKYLKRLEVDLSSEESLKVNDEGEPIIFIDAEGNLTAETTEDKSIPLTENSTSFVEGQVDKISEEFDIIEEDEHGEFIAWWIDKYKKAHFKVKEMLEERINVEDTFLQELSESIGFIFTQHLVPQSRFTHYGDEQQDVTTYPFSSIIDDKLEFDTKCCILSLNRRADAIFKRNMQQVISSVSISENPHRENVVTDALHLRRLNENQYEINEVIIDILKGAHKVFSWLTTNRISNKQKMESTVFEVVVENSKEKVDLLLNKIETLKRPFDISILKS